jgi:hypothetical protein
MPIIPFGGHPNWYQYNTMYWVGFSNKATNKILPAGPFGGTATSGLMQTVVLGLSAHVPVTYSNIAVSKANVVPAELTTISVNATNTGVAGTTMIQLLVNGSVVNSQDISFAANESKTVSFNVSRTTLGTYLANIGGLTTTFIVAQAAVVPAYIVGTVKDADTGNAISGARVTAGSYQTTTATNGSYSLQVATGTYIVTVTLEGYNSADTTVNAATGAQTYTANLALTAVPSGGIPLWIYGVIALFVVIAVVAVAYAFFFKKKK